MTGMQNIEREKHNFFSEVGRQNFERQIPTFSESRI